MKNFFKKTTLIPILFAMLIYSPLITSHATHLETQTKRQSLQKGSVVQDQHVFAIPDNGWNVVDIELDYYESYYSSTNTQNVFPFRQKFYMIKRSGAGANNISVDVSNALHTDGTNKVIISPFQQGDLLVDTSKWEWGQGMPDIGILPELGKALGVTVDEILMGEQIEQEKRAETAVSDEDKKLLEIVLERAERKAETIRITWKDVFGCLLILSAVGLIIVQIWTLTQGRELGLIYIRNVTPYVINAAAVFLFGAGGMCIEKLRPIWKRKSVIAVTAILLAAGIEVCPFCFLKQREIVDLAPDFSNTMCLKIDENGRAVFYRQRGLLFGAQSDVFPFTVKDDVKVQWLENDVCALTYESPEDDQVHQFVATYGDRNEAVSYYYVANVAYGTWMPEDRGENYKLEVGTGENGGIDIETPEGKEHYEPEECLQYGTLAVVFPSDDPKWTLVLNKDCVVEAGGSRIEEGGTVTLCKVAMEKTAPIIMH